VVQRPEVKKHLARETEFARFEPQEGVSEASSVFPPSFQKKEQGHHRRQLPRIRHSQVVRLSNAKT
jgi:hypothetical protein